MKKISIIIPVLNAASCIGQCLSALKGLDYNQDCHEIIIVDNGSSDDTVEIVKGFGFQPLIIPNAPISQLRNFGAQKAMGEVLAFIDADCIAPSPWLKDGLRLLSLTNVGAVGCWYKLPAKASFLEKVWDVHMGLRRLKGGPIDWVPSGNFMIRKSIFNQIGGFNELLTTSEDVDICRRLRDSGLFVYSHPGLAVVHLGESKDVRHFLIKEKWRGEGVLQDFIHGFPRSKLNKALLLACLTALSVVGIIAGSLMLLIFKNGSLLLLALSILMAAPVYLAFKSCASSKQWHYFIPLGALFFVYASGRAMSIFNWRVWRHEHKYC